MRSVWNGRRLRKKKLSVLFEFFEFDMWNECGFFDGLLSGRYMILFHWAHKLNRYVPFLQVCGTEDGGKPL